MLILKTGNGPLYDSPLVVKSVNDLDKMFTDMLKNEKCYYYSLFIIICLKWYAF